MPSHLYTRGSSRVSPGPAATASAREADAETHRASIRRLGVHSTVVVMLAFASAACGTADDPSAGPLPGTLDGAVGTPDAGLADTGLQDTRPEEAAQLDTGAEEGSLPDAGQQDASAVDGGTLDSGAQDGDPQQDTGAQDASAEDANPQDTGPQDTGPQDTGLQDTGLQDTGLQDTGLQDSGDLDSAPAVAVCGNGVTDSPEGCDDGNALDGDGCPHDCAAPEPGYACSGVPSSCATTCGDGVVAGVEECDDGNQVDQDACNNGCKRPRCAFVDGSEHVAIKAMAANLAQGQPLATAMANSGIPGLSVAIRDEHGVVYAAVFGNANNQTYDPGAPPLSPTTLFQAASISKSVSALAYLSSGVAAGTINTDILGTVDEFVVPPYAITPADLLSHSAGTTPHGFLGYLQGDALPTTEQIVLGQSPANTAAVTFVPAKKGVFSYSGGGYLLWQAWLERTTQMPLAAFVQENLFYAAGATRSTFTQALTSAQDRDVSCGHSPYLVANNLCRKVYPELAAAGLWTTPAELACVAGYVTQQHPEVLEIIKSRALWVDFNNGNYPQKMGVGMFHRPANGVDETDGHLFEHSGVNEGFLSQTVFFDDGRAVVAMDNGMSANGGVSGFAVRALCRELQWPCQGQYVAP